jgi:putative lipoprotein
MFAYGALRAADVDRRSAGAAAIAGSLALGVSKELFDRSQGGDFSTRDLVWDALGTLAGLAIISLDR